MNKILLICFSALFVSGFGQKKDISPQTIGLKQLNTMLHQKNDTLYVVNFWATWCQPCIDELPDFMAVNNLYKDHKKFKMILISLDSIHQLDKKVKSFIEENHIDATVYVLDEKRNAYEWMPEFDATWNGAIPSTAFFKNGEKLLFRSFQMTRYELEDLVNDFLN